MKINYYKLIKEKVLRGKQMSNKLLIVKCPHCAVKFEYYQSKFRPFCSERCRLIDLGCWLDESYRVPLKASEETIDEVVIDEENEDVEQEE
jgi:endogenous inhibitor of DNA gyrase (YacG/DUF329 family)